MLKVRCRMEYIVNFEDAAELLKIIGHPVRLCILRGLMDKESNVTNIQCCLGLPQSTISQHLSILRRKGIIKGKRNGLEVKYSLVNDTVEKILKIFEE